ncbi:YiaA/YiaB family inner membrane protein [Paenibacillus chondroitinus]|uniref:YiaA/YiaB family inner membrane protein n=1 Tax=Paenibacillus chondroitinus TaxID=59842 RepID=A0ABU6DJV1_9BACL|nr:YiaA/YiaB family inner membrane protein [Paenibacillus anseongense]MEB4798059.1 YiaA/YiaB family inner membrane protein [Paenibacillus chondroitinus]
MILNTRKRNTTAFTFMAWASFIGAFLAMFIGIYTLEESLSVKGYFAVCALFLTMSAFVLQKVIRDNLEDSYDSRKRNTSAFTFLAWSSFALALLGMFIGIINLEQLLSVKGYYAVTALFLTMSSFVLQKTVRDNNDDAPLQAVEKVTEEL